MKFLIVLFLLVTAACTKNSGSKDRNNILHVPLAGEISTLDPANSYDTISGSVVYQCYEQLFQYNYLKRPFVLEPLLAESMPKVENNGKRYIIKVKKNIQYHDHPVFKGKPRFLKAEDFITQIKRLHYTPTKSNGSWLFENKIKGIDKFKEVVGSDFEKFKSTKVEGLYTLDDYTLVIELQKEFPQMLFALAMSFTSPMPIEVVEATANNLNDTIIGTGPFKLKNWVPSSELMLVKNENYRESLYPSQGDRISHKLGLLKDSGKKMPFLNGIHFHIIQQANTRWLNFRKKKIDFLPVPKDNYETAITPSGGLTKELEKEGVQLQVVPTLTYWWLSFNMKDELLGKNLNLRKAIAHAIDTDRYIEVFTNNIGQKANSIYPPGIPGYDPTSKLPYGYNPELAKEYLAKAGYPNGKGLPELKFDVRGVNAIHRQQADFIKNELAKIGVKIQVILNTFPSFLKKSRNGKLQFWYDGWALDYPDAENSLQLLYSKNHPPGPNATYYSNPKFDKLFSKVALMPNGPQKTKLMKDLQDMVLEELPWVMLYYRRSYILYHNYVKNYRDSDIIYNSMKYYRVD